MNCFHVISWCSSRFSLSLLQHQPLYVFPSSTQKNNVDHNKRTSKKHRNEIISQKFLGHDEPFQLDFRENQCHLNEKNIRCRVNDNKLGRNVEQETYSCSFDLCCPKTVKIWQFLIVSSNRGGLLTGPPTHWQAAQTTVTHWLWIWSPSSRSMATVVWSLGVLNQNPGQRRVPSRSRARDRAGRARC